MTGKNFSGNNSKGTRKNSDFYETPYSITSRMLEFEHFDYKLPVLEPACGNGAITKILKKKWDLELINSYDINGGLNSPPKDFLTEESEYDYIITNPPFSLAYEFIQKCKQLTKKKFLLLLPLSYLHGKKRYDNIWTDTDFPLSHIHVFTRYPLLGEQLRDDGKYHTGMMVYAWYVWDRNHIGSPIIKWIDNNNDILLKQKK